MLKFRNAPAPDVCVARAYGFTRLSSSPRRARVFGCVHHSTKASCAGASFTVAVLWSVVVAFPTRRRFIDGGRALRARSAEDCETAIRKRIARTVVTTVTRALERQRSLFACTKSRNENRDLKAYSCTAVQLLCPHEYLYEYIYIAQDDYYSCRMAEGGFFYFYTHALLRCWCCVCTLQ